MANTFTYRGLDETGKAVRGELVAENVHSAAVLLKSQGLFPTEVTAAPERAGRAATGGSLWGALSGRDMAADVTILTRQLANLVGGGVPLMSAFTALTAHTENRRLRVVLEHRQEDVRRGKALWEALAASPEIFPQLYVNMVKAGEASGQLAAVLSWLADYREQEQARRLQIRAALAYPTLLVVTGMLAIVLLVTLVVPKFSAMYEEFGQALPLPTVVLLAVAGWLAHWGWALAVGLALTWFGLRRYARTTNGRLKVDRWRLRLPLFGKLLIKTAMSRFARTTAILMQGGVPLLDALAIVRDVLGNKELARATDRAREGMREGERFGARLQETGVFPGFLTHMIGIGEETGDLRNMLVTVADTYDVEVNATLKSLVSLLEPVIIISVGAVMGFIILSMLLPIFQIDLLGG